MTWAFTVREIVTLACVKIVQFHREHHAALRFFSDARASLLHGRLARPRIDR